MDFRVSLLRINIGVKIADEADLLIILFLLRCF